MCRAVNTNDNDMMRDIIYGERHTLQGYLIKRSYQKMQNAFLRNTRLLL